MEADRPTANANLSWHAPVTTANRRTVLLVAVLVVLPALAGWLTTDAASPAGCDRFAVPHARGGDAYAYDARGPFRDLWVGPIVDWRAVNPWTDQDRGPLELPEGSSVHVFVRDGSTLRVNVLGESVPSVQATYWAEHPDEPEPLPFQDEWTDADTGRLVQLTNRAYGVAYNGTVEEATGQADERHFTLFKTPARPGFLFAQHFWGMTLWEGRSGNHSWPDAPLTPDWHRRAEFFNWTVTDIRPDPEEARCIAELEMEVLIYSGTMPLPADVRLVLASDVPAPLGYRWSPTWGPPSLAPTVLRLADWSPGSGAAVPDSRDVQGLEEMGPTTLDRRPLVDGFVADRGGFFATDYDDALAAVLEDPKAQEWLADHPTAVPGEVEHTPGPPPEDDVKLWDLDRQVVDQWSWTWMPREAADGTKLNTVYQKRRVLPVVGGGTEDHVSVHVFNGTKLADPPANATTLAALSDVYARHAGRAPTLVECGFMEDRYSCLAGTADATRSDGPGHWGEEEGFEVWYERGWIDHEDSYDDAAAGPPAGAGAMSDDASGS